MKGIIWYQSDREKAVKKMLDILFEYQAQGIGYKRVYMTRSSPSIFLDNGDTWSCHRAGIFARGHRCDTGLIDSAIPQDVVDTIVKPCSKSYDYY